MLVARKANVVFFPDKLMMNVHLHESLNCCQFFHIKASTHAFETHGIQHLFQG